MRKKVKKVKVVKRAAKVDKTKAKKFSIEDSTPAEVIVDAKINEPQKKSKDSIVIPAEIVIDPRLGRRPQADPRSGDFPVTAILPRKVYETPRTKTWNCGPVLDQLNEGSCVGHGWAHELAAEPYAIKGMTHKSAVTIYKAAQNVDEWPGNTYSGTSVLAGAKAVMKLFPGSVESYRWANTINDVIAAIGWHGPVVVGCNWYSGMYQTDAKGYIHVSGSQVGGHCLLMRGVDIEKNHFILRNSWGPSWGKAGDCFISFQDFSRLLSENADCCVIVTRGWWK